MKNILLILILIILSGCEKDIFFDIPEHKPKIVVNGILENDSILRIYVSKTRTTGKDEAIKFLTDAKVELYQNGNFIETLKSVEYISPIDTTYFFTAALLPAVGENYTIKVSADDFESVEGSFTIPAPVPLIDVKLIEVIRQNDNFSKTATAEIIFKDPVPDKNYYHIKIFTVLEPPYLAPIGYQVNEYFATHAAYGDYAFDYSYMWDDIYFSGLEKRIILTFDALPYDAVYKIELRSVSKEYFNYYQTLYLQQQNSNGPFAEPINIYSNIKNGYGVIAGFSAVSDTIFIPE